MDQTPVPAEFDVELDGDDRAAPRDAPMLEMTIRLFGWRPGEAEIETTVFPDSRLGDPFRAPPAEAATVLDRLHARLREEMAVAFDTFRNP